MLTYYKSLIVIDALCVIALLLAPKSRRYKFLWQFLPMAIIFGFMTPLMIASVGDFSKLEASLRQKGETSHADTARNDTIMAACGVAANVTLVVFYVARIVVLWRRQIDTDRRAAGGLCLTCGYSLTANISGVCPECGTTIAPQPPARP
jgi:uncharacterized membrane protein YhaH (DUF805 family)